MRARKRKNTPERIQACGELYIDRESFVDFFKGDTPVHLEIGCGKGDFVVGMAKKHPELKFLAIEKIPDVAVIALEKVRAEGLENVRFTCMDAFDLPDAVGEYKFERIYLNFSDPWPKKRHAKRRLTSEVFLDIYKRILSESGEIHFKTDNAGLFEYSLESFTENGFELKNTTDDLHKSEWAEGNVMTEYERNFSAKGFTIHRTEAFLKRE
ncbi:MAG: tRNA (guanosine(46)-N7)-methyltransferase TrmB [Clostridia bacterium]|nr:tRNA (guanosine(46)-N7)-methyltransferase TrmB [Clostridia bacterium]